MGRFLIAYSAALFVIAFALARWDPNVSEGVAFIGSAAMILVWALVGFAIVERMKRRGQFGVPMPRPRPREPAEGKQREALYH
jgi:hypothetical protein